MTDVHIAPQPSRPGTAGSATVEWVRRTFDDLDLMAHRSSAHRLDCLVRHALATLPARAATVTGSRGGRVVHHRCSLHGVPDRSTQVVSLPEIMLLRAGAVPGCLCVAPVGPGWGVAAGGFDDDALVWQVRLLGAGPVDGLEPLLPTLTAVVLAALGHPRGRRAERRR